MCSRRLQAAILVSDRLHGAPGAAWTYGHAHSTQSFVPGIRSTSPHGSVNGALVHRVPGGFSHQPYISMQSGLSSTSRRILRTFAPVGIRGFDRATCTVGSVCWWLSFGSADGAIASWVAAGAREPCCGEVLGLQASISMKPRLAYSCRHDAGWKVISTHRYLSEPITSAKPRGGTPLFAGRPVGSKRHTFPSHRPNSMRPRLSER